MLLLLLLLLLHCSSLATSSCGPGRACLRCRKFLQQSGHSQLLAWQGVLALPQALLAPALQVCADILVAQPGGHQLQECQEPAVGGLQLRLPQAVPDGLPEEPMGTQQCTCREVLGSAHTVIQVLVCCQVPLGTAGWHMLQASLVASLGRWHSADLADWLKGADSGLLQMLVKAGWRSAQSWL